MEKDSDKKYAMLRQMLMGERNNAGLKQSDVSSALNKPQSYISKIERGERGMDLIEFIEIAEVVGFDSADFIRRLITSTKS